MKKIHSPQMMLKQSRQWRIENKTVALVPTMGALHEGHLSLIEMAKKKADKVIVSIFVNPTQFGPNEDYENYPRTLNEDLKKCRELGVDAVFAPSPAEMYMENSSTWVNEESLSRYLCGARRKGHFRGVCTVVMKLFMICAPDIAVFGQKDAQQATIIKRMVRDLNIPVKIIVAPIKRESDGLAMSSRNKYLSPSERKQAPIIYKGLREIKNWKKEDLTVALLRRKLIRYIQQEKDIRIDYVSIVDAETLAEISRPEKGQKLLVAVAVFFNKARLIDNIEIRW